MSTKLLLLLSSFCCLLVVYADAPSHVFQLNLDPEVNYNPMQFITSKGYPGEEHWVQTSDGYILGVYRIPAGKNQSKGPRPVFFLQHGLLTSCTNWLSNSANESLAYILADHGYDVWMGNTRGNTYSRNHTSLKPDQKEFWDFSFDQHAQIDLPAMLDYVLKVSGQKQLFYVGHSQGTIMGFAGFTFNQTLATKVKAFFALAPVAYLEHIEGGFKFISDNRDEIAWIFNNFENGEFMANNELIKFLGKYLCSEKMASIKGLCEGVLFLLCGFDPSNLNESRLPIYYTHNPAGTSVKNGLHLTQEIKSGRFAMYDYGSSKLNMQHYGVSPSPSYNVTDMKVPMALFSGGRDWLADPKDVARLFPLLNSTGKVFFHKNIDYYDHLDFIWGMDAANVIYKDIIDLAEKMKDDVYLSVKYIVPSGLK